jgi:hypothetical protein
MLEIQNYSRWHINTVVKEESDDAEWKLTGFYGQPYWTKRKESWDLLCHLKTFQLGSWQCFGNFNEILTQCEKSGGANRKEA